MGILRNSYKPVILLFSVVLAGTASAAEPALSPLMLNARYDVAWSGIPLGRIRILASEDATSYRMTIDTKTKGIGALISDEKRILSGEGKKSPTGDYIPASYSARPQKDKIDRVITLTYDANGKIVTRTREPDDDPAWRPLVSHDKINTASDPITAIFALRTQLYQAHKEGKPEVSGWLYDGARLMKTTLIRAPGEARVAALGSYKQTINLSFQRLPLDGYTPKELKRFKSGDPEMHIYLSADEKFIPLRATAKTAIGELSMTLVELQ